MTKLTTIDPDLEPLRDVIGRIYRNYRNSDTEENKNKVVTFIVDDYMWTVTPVEEGAKIEISRNRTRQPYDSKAYVVYPESVNV